MDYKIVGTAADGTPIKQPIWETMTPEEQEDLNAKIEARLAGLRDLRAIDEQGFVWYGDVGKDPVLDENGKQMRVAPWSEQPEES